MTATNNSTVTLESLEKERSLWEAEARKLEAENQRLREGIRLGLNRLHAKDYITAIEELEYVTGDHE